MYELRHGDCLDILKTLKDNSIDSIVTDPPYGLNFMGKQWDYDVPGADMWAECLRVLKPGGHLLAFAGTRTQHRMAVNIEDAGFELRDMIAWVYGSGFPKSKNLDGNWQGWGTALKPALEPITVARKPLIGTVAENVLAHGTGALNIDGCRVGTEVRYNAPAGNAKNPNTATGPAQVGGFGMKSDVDGTTVAGRWPANLIHDGSEEVVALFPDSAGSGGSVPNVKVTGYGGGVVGSGKSEYFGGPRTKVNAGSGSAARFFYCAKANKKDRNEGCEHLAAKQYSHDGCETPIDNAYQRNSSSSSSSSNSSSSSSSSNHHPTVKPTDLMRYLCRLVTPPGGLVLDPFTGSGSTGKAAILEGFSFLGIEREAEYVAIAQGRIAAALNKIAEELAG